MTLPTFCLQLKIKAEALQWIQGYMNDNGMFVSDAEYQKCALDVLGKEDQVSAKKEVNKHQAVKLVVR